MDTPAPYRPVRETIAEIVGNSIKPMAREAGFKYKGLNYHRRRGELIQVINIQLSRWNFGDRGGFYINIGIAFDKLTALAGNAFNERLPESRCHFRRRIADFCPDAPDRWIVDATTDLDKLTDILRNDFKSVLQTLNAVASIDEFLRCNLIQADSPDELLVKLHYVSGRMDEAWQALKLYAACFADSQASSPPELIQRWHVPKLSFYMK